MSHKTLALALAGLAAPAAALLFMLHEPQLDCSGGGRLCPKVPEVEAGSKMAAYDLRAAHNGQVPPGALRAAVEQKAAMESAKASVSGANGTWRAYGKGPLISSGLAQTLGADLGVSVPDTNNHIYAGRIDNFAYDPVAKRLFAAPGTGGIWMSEAIGGDVRTIGNRWQSIGDNLPSQANGGVIWTSAGGGTLVSAGGDSVMSTGAYLGIGAYWSNDLGATWNRSEGYPDEALVFNTETDPGNPRILYIASSRGLWRSEDAGRSFNNVALPVTPECAGNIDRSSPCNLASVVSDVVVKAPGGIDNFECSFDGCPVLAAVGWRAGAKTYPDGVTPQSPSNGLYKSATGAPGSFVRLNPPAVDPVTQLGFAPPERIGRIEMGTANGPDQDHGYVYAMVQDAARLNGAALTLDPPLDELGTVPLGTLINGAYVSPDFGDTWIRMASAAEIGSIPGPLLAIVSPGVQSWYNQWVAVDPTRAVPVLGIPTRLTFGLEEVFQNLGSPLGIPVNGYAQAGPQDFQNIGYYFSAAGVDQTTHPDQHAAIYVPTGDLPFGDGGVCLFVGNDGGVAKQCVIAGEEFDNRKWGRGYNAGFNTLLPYGLGVAKDGTVWFGLQDNGSGHMDPDTGEAYGDFGADGFYAEVDPDNSDIAYTESQNGGLRRTVNRGATASDIAPPYLRVNFANWFSMDPLDAQHMVTGANEIYETLEAETVTGSSWIEVYNLGSNQEVESDDVLYTAAVMDVHGPAIYAGACGDCGVTINDTGFRNLLATNIGGKEPPNPGTSDGWHDAKAKGLPNRFIAAIEIDPTDPKIVYVGLGGYMSGLRGPGTFGDQNMEDPQVNAGNIFKSTDAGETFKSITGNLPNLPINTIVARGEQLLIGTDFGTFISADLEGASWAPLGNLLPNVPVTQLKLQPGNPNKVFASTFGRGFWTYEFPPEARLEVLPGVSSPADSNRFGGALGSPLLLVLLGALKLRRRR